MNKSDFSAAGKLWFVQGPDIFFFPVVRQYDGKTDLIIFIQVPTYKKVEFDNFHKI